MRVRFLQNILLFLLVHNSEFLEDLIELLYQTTFWCGLVLNGSKCIFYSLPKKNDMWKRHISVIYCAHQHSEKKHNLHKFSFVKHFIISCFFWFSISEIHFHVKYLRPSLAYYTERQKKHNFLEWCPLTSTASKWMIFGLMLATVLLITHVKKQKKSKVPKMR